MIDVGVWINSTDTDYGPMSSSCANGNKNSGFTRDVEFTNQLCVYWLVKKGYAPWSYLHSIWEKALNVMVSSVMPTFL